MEENGRGNAGLLPRGISGGDMENIFVLLSQKAVKSVPYIS